MAASSNIVLVHGAWADGSCWSTVIERLQADGYKVTVPQLPETSLADDVARVRQRAHPPGGPTVLAAHSYGGQVITSLGTDAPNVFGLVYVAGFGLDEGESIGALRQQGPRPRLWRMSISTRRASAGPQRRFPRSLRRRYRPGQGEGPLFSRRRLQPTGSQLAIGRALLSAPSGSPACSPRRTGAGTKVRLASRSSSGLPAPRGAATTTRMPS